VGPFGPVHLASSSQFEIVLELERLEAQPLHPRELPPEAWAPIVLEHLNACVGLEHPNVACCLGAGLADGVPYVLRAHTLGRTLAELALDEVKPPPDVAAGILFSVAEGIAYLSESGPRPGVCALGGLKREAVLLGWDGSVQLLGAGLAILGDSRLDADFRGLRHLASELEPDLGELVADAADLAEASKRIRRWRRDACAQRRGRLGAWLRRVDGEACDALRRFFGLGCLN
jgi:hypothetical protein